MIQVGNDDIGREVLYMPQHAGAKPEAGIITSFNDAYVFVRYGNSSTSQATRREDLRYAHGG